MTSHLTEVNMRNNEASSSVHESVHDTCLSRLNLDLDLELALQDL